MDFGLCLDGISLPIVSEAEVLGATLAFHGQRLEHVMDKKAEQAEGIATRIMAVPLSFEQRSLLTRALVTSKVIHGSSVVAVPFGRLKKLGTRVVNCVWGRTCKLRCREVFFSLLSHGHALDPTWAVSYDSVLV